MPNRAGFRKGGLELGKKSSFDSSNPNTITLQADSSGNLYAVDESGTPTPVGTETTSADLSGSFVLKSGDTMTGQLTVENTVIANEYQTLLNGSANTAFGEFAMSNVESGAGSNCAFGRNALLALTTGDNNIAIGNAPLFDNTTGSDNIGIGTLSLFENVSGEQNVAVGSQTLRNCNSDSNVAVGHYTLTSLNTVTSNDNIGIGRRAADTTTSCSQSIFIGTSASPQNNSGDTNEIVIGYNTSGNGTNTVTIGNSSITKTYLRGVVDRTLENNENQILILDDLGQLVASGVTTVDLSGSGTQVTAEGVDVTTMELSGGIPTSLVPDTSGVYDLGSAENPWRSGYFTNESIFIGNDKLSTSNGQLLVNDSPISSESVSGAVYQGSELCNTSDSVYTISHDSVDISSIYPQVSLTIPTSSSLIYAQGITNRSSTSFDVILSGTPESSGYSINWLLVDGVGGGESSSGGTQITNGGVDVDSMELSGGIPTSLVPDASGVYDLGSSDTPWKNVYSTGDSYSTDEIKTNSTWIDGKTIYRKVVTLTDRPNGPSDPSDYDIANNAHNISNLGIVTDQKIIFYDGAHISIDGSNSYPAADDETSWVTATDVGWGSPHDRTDATYAYAIIEYTKS